MADDHDVQPTGRKTIHPVLAGIATAAFIGIVFDNIALGIIFGIAVAVVLNTSNKAR